MAPSPRSGCQMVALADGRILILNGYSKTKLKKDVDKGVVHTDAFILAPESASPRVSPRFFFRHSTKRTGLWYWQKKKKNRLPQRPGKPKKVQKFLI